MHHLNCGETGENCSPRKDAICQYREGKRHNSQSLPKNESMLLFEGLFTLFLELLGKEVCLCMQVKVKMDNEGSLLASIVS